MNICACLSCTAPFGGRPNRHQILLVGGNTLGRKNLNTHSNVVRSGWYRRLPSGWVVRSAKCDGFHRPAPPRHLFHCWSLPRHDVWRICLPVLCCHLLLVPQSHRKKNERKAWQASFLVDDCWHAYIDLADDVCRICTVCDAALRITTLHWGLIRIISG